LIAVIPGAIGNSAITSEWLGVLNENAPASSIDLTHAGVAMLLAPGHVLQAPFNWLYLKLAMVIIFGFGSMLERRSFPGSST
jgi:hypothetical protein